MTHSLRFVQRIADLEAAHLTGRLQGREYEVIQTLLLRAHGKVYGVAGRNQSQTREGSLGYIVPVEDIAA